MSEDRKANYVQGQPSKPGPHPPPVFRETVQTWQQAMRKAKTRCRRDGISITGTRTQRVVVERSNNRWGYWDVSFRIYTNRSLDPKLFTDVGYRVYKDGKVTKHSDLKALPPVDTDLALPTEGDKE